MAQTTKDLFKGISQIDICLSVFIFQNTNSCISSIINESPTTFRFMQIFEMTVINKCMFCPTLVFIRFDITYTYVHYIINFSHNTGCNPGFSFYFKYWSHLNKISHTSGILYIKYISIFHSSRRELSVKFMFVNIFYNPRGRINNSIL